MNIIVCENKNIDISEMETLYSLSLRKIVSETGRPVFDIDYTKNPAQKRPLQVR